jgi:hypothetical protein
MEASSARSAQELSALAPNLFFQVGEKFRIVLANGV